MVIRQTGGSISSSIGAQQDPAHHAPCLTPKRIASKSAAAPRRAALVANRDGVREPVRYDGECEVGRRRRRNANRRSTG